jgi:hypothetical protein
MSGPQDLEAEPLAETDAAHVDVVDDVARCTLHKNPAFMEDIGAIDDLEGLRFLH